MPGKRRVKRIVRLVGFTAAVVVVVALSGYRSFGSSSDTDNPDQTRTRSEPGVQFDPDIQLSGRSIRHVVP